MTEQEFLVEGQRSDGVLNLLFWKIPIRTILQESCVSYGVLLFEIKGTTPVEALKTLPKPKKVE